VEVADGGGVIWDVRDRAISAGIDGATYEKLMQAERLTQTSRIRLAVIPRIISPDKEKRGINSKTGFDTLTPPLIISEEEEPLLGIEPSATDSRQ
jgi:hypothetical protein